MKNFITRRVNRDEVFAPFEDHFNRIFENVFKDFYESPVKIDKSHGYPKLDVFEKNIPEKKITEFIIKATIPGLTSDDISVQISEENILSISGGYKGKEISSDTVYYIKEFSSSSFIRSIRLPEYIKGDPKVEILNGILTLTWAINYLQEESKIRKIDLKPK